MKNTLIRYEWHHIIPRRLGGTDHPSNKIKIPITDHAIWHINNAINEIFKHLEDDNGEWYAAAMVVMRLTEHELDEVECRVGQDDLDYLSYYIDIIRCRESLKVKRRFYCGPSVAV